MINETSFLAGFQTAVVLMASLHGLLLALILFLNRGLRSLSNRYLALAILAASVVLSLDIVYFFDLEERLPLVFQYLPLYWRAAVPVGIFYFILYMINPEHKLTSLEKSGFIFIALEITTELFYIPVNAFASNDISIEYWEDVLVMIEQLIGLVASFFFFWLSIKKVEEYQRYLYNNYSTTRDKSLSWLRPFLWMNFVVTILWLISYIQQIIGFYEAAEVMFIWSTIGLGLLLYIIGYSLILKYNWFHTVPIKNKPQEDVASQSKLSSKTDAYYEGLMELMNDEKLYADVELTLQSLSERLGISAGYLSKIINQKEGKSFFEFVNEFRIFEVKKKLVDKDYEHYSILGVALESGFKSKTTFNSVFKKFTGQTPSAYQKQFLSITAKK